ncbi:unnamed protein product [Cuscuta europaea]|uniref:Pectin acetylesterase n=1 Tax=Cuscuta europaea TaxID=41803 RepID=A0A9P0YQG7_CUSEU|nr:unnamed protein product [Cuscuta europaea]
MAKTASPLNRNFLILFALVLAAVEVGGRKDMQDFEYTKDVHKLMPVDLEGSSTMVNPTLVTIDDGAVCLSGKPAAYYLLPGYDTGITNWLVYLNGGGWCQNVIDCQYYITHRGLDQDAIPVSFQSFDDILSDNRDHNPGFYNWNKVSIRYCDGSSFTGSSEIIENGTTYYFRGARIFKAVMQELLAKGMASADNI